MPSIDVCFSPELLHLYNLSGKVAVVVDVLRATSSMVTAFAHGIEKIIPVSTLDDCLTQKQTGYLTAAERDGRKAEGFDLGNSPFSYMEENIKGKTLIMTTTNGTHAIRLSAAADKVLAGAFLNVGKVAEFLEAEGKDVLVVCAGWKGNFNLEDTLFAGALAERLKDTFSAANDATLAAQHLYRLAQPDMAGFLANSSHVQRLKNLDITEDVTFCLREDVYEVVPVLAGDSLVPLKSLPVS
ncbi:2-phosphosulfolactate phosphatase [Adhaeribacter rhizoryzae]|uniref:Probable 2-phosphosulfolactate phosphatase n=1 Tax=Adhaeribacter rhizoryzae TaxID=2607907 RepID=A0A5M6D283_9BACT|nr:2-phosphosulfolactate phosphatase [Adhaeribacter rhizoryzae]KAA5539245.1 2-phosphosulfolactate phosphatase [Adhaeribacter rhizoryzae]